MNKNAQNLAKLRWKKTTPEERSEHARMMKDQQDKLNGWGKYSQKEKERALKMVAENGLIEKN